MLKSIIINHENKQERQKRFNELRRDVIACLLYKMIVLVGDY